jgi:hypothetical protein
MADQQGFSFFDRSGPSDGPPPPAAPDFPAARRGGYDRAAVDDFLREREVTMRRAIEDVAAANAQIEALEARIAMLNRRLAEAETPRPA